MKVAGERPEISSDPPGHPARGRLCDHGRSPGSRVVVFLSRLPGTTGASDAELRQNTRRLQLRGQPRSNLRGSSNRIIHLRRTGVPFYPKMQASWDLDHLHLVARFGLTANDCHRSVARFPRYSPLPDFFFDEMRAQALPAHRRRPSRSPSRSISSIRVRVGLALLMVGNTEAAPTHRLGMANVRRSPSTTAVRGSVPMRVDPVGWKMSPEPRWQGPI